MIRLEPVSGVRMARRGNSILDPNHPQSIHVYDAAGLIDAVMGVGQQMSVSPSAMRREILTRCLPCFEEMRQLNRDQFGNSRYIADAIDEYESGIRGLAALGRGQITEDRQDGDGNCPYCSSKIMKVNPLPGITGLEECFLICCPVCCELFMPAEQKLSSFRGFGTDFI